MMSISAKMALCIAAFQCQQVFAVASKSAAPPSRSRWFGGSRRPDQGSSSPQDDLTNEDRVQAFVSRAEKNKVKDVSGCLVQASSTQQTTSLEKWGDIARTRFAAESAQGAAPSSPTVQKVASHDKAGSLPPNASLMDTWTARGCKVVTVNKGERQFFQETNKSVRWFNIPTPNDAFLRQFPDFLVFAPRHVRDAEHITWELPHGNIVATKNCERGMLGSKSTYWSYQIHLNESEQEAQTFRVYGLNYRNKYLYSKLQSWNKRVKSIDLAMLLSLAECMNDYDFRTGLDPLTRMVQRKTYNLYRITDPLPLGSDHQDSSEVAPYPPWHDF
jgi:hypothetical protein